MNGRNSPIRLAALSFLLADPNPHSSAIIHSILRGFGATRIIEVRSRHHAIQVLSDQRVDMMLIEPSLPEGGGLAFVRSIRQDDKSPWRFIPMLIVTADTRASMIKAARDCGANMVIAKPVSPASLYERLTWVAINPRSFAGAPPPDSEARQSPRNDVAISFDGGPTLSQNEIDSLLQGTAFVDPL